MITIKEVLSIEVLNILMDGKNVSDQWSIIVQQRNLLLAECDWTQLPDAVLTLEERQMWQDYRQALRDIPQNYATPEEAIFPAKPGGV